MTNLGGPARTGVRQVRGWLLVVGLLVLGQGGWGSCSDDSGSPTVHPVRSCLTLLSFQPDHPVRTVAVAGSFNGWSETSDKLTDPDGDGIYSIELALGRGDYAYKFVVDGDWILDPKNPYRIWVDGVENSRLRIGDCHEPTLRLVSFETGYDDGSGSGSLSARVQFVAGADAPGPAEDQLKLFVNREDRSDLLEYDPETRMLQVDMAGLAPDKYTLQLTAADTEGATAETRLVGWVEKERFSWKDALIYFVFTDRFRDGDPSNDDPAPGVEPKANYEGGDYAGVLQELQQGYFDDLGVRALWLSPPQQNPDGGWPGADGRDYTGYHGYWPSQPRTSQPRFGTLPELQHLTAEAHKHGIRVLADAVMNHVHIEHPYYRDHATDGWFHGDGSCVCGRDGCDWETHKIDCWFAEYTPDLNYENPAVVDQMTSDLLWWVWNADLDGLRCDAVKHMRQVAIMTLAATLGEQYEQTGIRFYLVGETFTGEDGRWEISEFIGPHKLDGQFDFPLYWAMLDTFARQGRAVSALDDAVRAQEGFYPPDTVMSPFLGNHDVPRLFSHAAGDIGDLWGNGSKDQGWTNPPGPSDSDEPYRRVALAFTFLLTMPGAPLIYYGDEMGMPGAGDPDNRRMMRFGDDLTAREKSLLAKVQRLGKLRERVRALRRGDRMTLYVDDDRYLFARRDPDSGQAALVAINRSETDWTGLVYLPSSLGLEDGTQLRDEMGEAGTTEIQGGAVEVQVPAMEGAVYVTQ